MSIMDIKEFIKTEIGSLKESSRTPAIELMKVNRDLDKVIDIFLRVIDYKIIHNDYNGVGIRIKTVLDKLCNEKISYHDMSILVDNITINCEKYARIVLFLTEPSKLKEIDDKRMGYCAVLKRIGVGNSLVGEMTPSRNDGSHKGKNLSMSEAYTQIDQCLFDYLLITNCKINELQRVVCLNNCESNIEFFPDAFISSIIAEYENSQIKYLDVNWYSAGNIVNDMNIKELLSNIDETSQDMVFLGEAGIGKTTALKRIQYELARMYQNKQSCKIPVFVSLGELNGEPFAITNAIATIAHLDRDTVRQHLKNGTLVLILDGYNEVLEPSIQKSLAKEIDNNIRSNYKEVSVFLSDRAISLDYVPVMQNATKLFLKELSLTQKLQFIKDRVNNEIYSLILNHSKQKPMYYDDLESPYKLIQFIELVTASGSIPDNIVESYITALIEREKNEKKELEMKNIEEFLQALALFMSKHDKDYGTENPKIARIDAITYLARVKDALGYNSDTSRVLDVAVGMNILREECRFIEFCDRRYYTYFKLRGVESGIMRMELLK